VAELLRPETSVYFFFFVVPGFVAVRTYELIVPSERRSFGESFIDLIAYSFLILAFWTLPFFTVVNNRDAILASVGPLGYFLLFGVIMVLIVGVSPVLLAIAYYKIRTLDFFRGRIVHPSPTGWDWYFSREPRRVWILFHLKSGEVVGGFFGGKSSASSYPINQQIYVEEVWELGDNYEFLDKVDQTNGAIINKEDCNVIELFVFEEHEGSGRGEEEE
jgi:hypothetical protein